MVRNKRSIRFFGISPETDKEQLNLNIFNILKKETALSISGIAERACLSDDIVAEHINSCVKKGLLKISGSGEGEPVKFNSDFGNILGVGFSEETCVLTVMDLNGGIISKEQVGIRPLGELKGKNKEINDIIEKIGTSTRFRETEFYCAGVAVPERLKEINSKSPDILAEGISHLFDCDVLVGMAATAAGYGEREFGAQTKGRDVLYMHSDVGNGVAIKSEMIFEADEKADGEKKAYLRPWSQFNIVATARSLVNKGVGTDIVNMVDGDIDRITLGVVLNAAERNDELAEDLVKRSGLALGVRVAYLINMFNTDIVILGGGTEKKEGSFAQFVRESAKKFLFKDRADKLEIVPGVLGKEAFSVGAALLCRRELFMEV
ncbi:ROK family protein [Candidatus Omnitrophota bacterium]